METKQNEESKEQDNDTKSNENKNKSKYQIKHDDNSMYEYSSKERDELFAKQVEENVCTADENEERKGCCFADYDDKDRIQSITCSLRPCINNYKCIEDLSTVHFYQKIIVEFIGKFSMFSRLLFRIY